MQGLIFRFFGFQVFAPRVSSRSATPDASMTLQEPAWRVKSKLKYLLVYVTLSLSFSTPLPVLSARTMYVR